MAKPLNLEDANQLVAKKSDAQLRLNISRNMLMAILVSLLIHLAFLVVVKIKPIEVGASQPAPITVTLNDVEPIPMPAQAEIPKPDPVKEPVKPVKEIVKQKKIITTQGKSTFKVPVIEAPKEEPQPVTQPTPEPTPVKPAPEIPVIPPGMDMNDYLKAQREKRRLALGLNSKDFNDSVSGKRELSADEKRDEVIKQNLKNGQNGIFQILNLNTYSAQFSFRGWTNDFSNAKKQVISVEIGAGGDIQRAVIKRMIILIRQYYDGDFNWESQRLGRTVVLSARAEDNDALEAFMIKEFF